MMPFINSLAKQRAWYLSRYEGSCRQHHLSFKIPPDLACCDILVYELALANKVLTSTKIAVRITLGLRRTSDPWTIALS